MTGSRGLKYLLFGAVVVAALGGVGLGFDTVPGVESVPSETISVPADDAGTEHDTAGSSSGETDSSSDANHEGGTDHGDDADHGGGMNHGGGMDHGGMNHGSMDMQMVENGMVVNGNAEQLPAGCETLAGERSVTVRGGVEYSDGGEMFSFERDRLEVDPCTRVTVTFVNDDNIRHQWMVHGLPTESYPMGMFNIEVNGPGSATGSFVTPAEDTTLNTHCSLSQHEQKGMQMSVVVGDGGSGDGHGGH
jgi:plastocyanin